MLTKVKVEGGEVSVAIPGTCCPWLLKSRWLLKARYQGLARPLPLLLELQTLYGRVQDVKNCGISLPLGDMPGGEAGRQPLPAGSDFVGCNNNGVGSTSFVSGPLSPRLQPKQHLQGKVFCKWTSL